MEHSPRKQQILRTAARLFKERGYSAVTMRDISRALDIKASSLYNHITSKQEILSDLIVCIAEEFTSGMDAIINLNCSSREKLQKAIELHIDITLKHGDSLAALNNDWMHLQDALPHFLEMRNRYETNFRTIIEEGIQNGSFEKRNIDIVLFTFLSILQTFHLWYAKHTTVSVPQLKQEMVNVLLQGIVKPI